MAHCVTVAIAWLTRRNSRDMTEKKREGDLYKIASRGFLSTLFPNVIFLRDVDDNCFPHLSIFSDFLAALVPRPHTFVLAFDPSATVGEASLALSKSKGIRQTER